MRSSRSRTIRMSFASCPAPPKKRWPLANGRAYWEEVLLTRDFIQK